MKNKTLNWEVLFLLFCLVCVYNLMYMGEISCLPKCEIVSPNVNKLSDTMLLLRNICTY